MQQPPQNPQWGQEPQQPGGQPGQYPQQQPQWQQPIQPLQQTPRRSHKGLWIILAVVGILLFGCIGAVALVSKGATTTNTGSVATSGSTSAATSAPASHFKVGQVVNVSDTWQMTVLSAKTSAGSEFYKPSSGNVYLIFVISMKNVSSAEQNVSSDLQFTLQDSTGQKYTETIDPDAGATLDGKVEAGSPLKGSIVYEAPKSIKQFTLAFEESITSAGQTIWNISV